MHLNSSTALKQSHINKGMWKLFPWYFSKNVFNFPTKILVNSAREAQHHAIKVCGRHHRKEVVKMINSQSDSPGGPVWPLWTDRKHNIVFIVKMITMRTWLLLLLLLSILMLIWFLDIIRVCMSKFIWAITTDKATWNVIEIRCPWYRINSIVFRLCIETLGYPGPWHWQWGILWPVLSVIAKTCFIHSSYQSSLQI